MKTDLFQKLAGVKLANMTGIAADLIRKGAIHVFETSIVFIVIASILGLVVYLQYRSPEITEAVPSGTEPPRFKSDLYQKVIKELEERERMFWETAGETYRDPFYPQGEFGE